VPTFDSFDAIDDLRVSRTEALTPPVDVLRSMPNTPAVSRLVRETRAAVGRVLRGEDPRLLVVVGPCSIHDTAGAMEYAQWVLEASRALADRLLVIMRVYFEKPRTRGGWKGLINDPALDGSFRINEGLRLARGLLLDINGLGLPTATEFVDLITPQYISDLISWAAVGARTTESQVHRELASGLSMPVGFKNGTTGDVKIAINALVAASNPHHFLGVTKSGSAAIVATRGNHDCHLILRGGVRPNYDEYSIDSAVAALVHEGVCPRVMIDCSHGNCGGDYRRQLVVAQEITRQLAAGSPHVCGVMVESHLTAGSQRWDAGQPRLPTQSITDPCIGIADTTTLLSALAERRISTYAC
jgi:3-deoxy-7-phosphoheptulonate synthase